MERGVAATRVGVHGPCGAAAQVPVAGLVAAVFGHWDSRAADLQMHSHVTIANRVAPEHEGPAPNVKPFRPATLELSAVVCGRCCAGETGSHSRSPRSMSSIRGGIHPIDSHTHWSCRTKSKDADSSIFAVHSRRTPSFGKYFAT
ncbi:MAG: relaxase domain-containing protein [Bifidobacteriaceae bacterium]|nr:relaxase domain-containing protein [Bifidobacteriaceae bacterium]